MANPAALLHYQLDRWRVTPGQGIRDVRVALEGSDAAVIKQTQVAMGYLRDIEEILTGMEASGRRTRSFRQALPRWQAWVLAYPHSWTHLVSSDIFNSEHDLDVLENLADALDLTIPVFTEQDRSDIAATLEETRKALADDESLPLPLRRHLHGVLKHVSSCLEEYETFGDFDLQKAIDRLLVSVNAAGQVSKDPSKWQTIKEKLAYPIMVGLAVQIPGSVSQMAQILP